MGLDQSFCKNKYDNSKEYEVCYFRKNYVLEDVIEEITGCYLCIGSEIEINEKQLLRIIRHLSTRKEEWTNGFKTESILQTIDKLRKLHKNFNFSKDKLLYMQY